MTETTWYNSDMDAYPYHSYLFFNVSNAFYQLPEAEQSKHKRAFLSLLEERHNIQITAYATLGFKADTTYMLWCCGADPTDAQDLLRDIVHTGFGQWLTLSYSYFGIVRPSSYSGRTGKPEQVIQNYAERLPYLILYPFTKTTDWYQLDFENRKSIMGQHIKTGVAHADIRQCLLYSYGIDDHEFLVSYETETLESFQDLIMEMRKTIGRKYTLSDTPIFTCVHKPLKELLEWL
jgi:chlorite dismutase